MSEYGCLSEDVSGTVLGLVRPADIDGPEASHSEIDEKGGIGPYPNDENNPLKIAHSSLW